MPGLGSWSHHYSHGDDYRHDPQGRFAHGVRALKRELIYSGYAAEIVAELPAFDGPVTAQVLAVQAAHGLEADGIIGPETALVLFRKRAAWVEKRYGIKSHWLSKIKTYGSNNDPVAQGPEPDYEGVVQINLHFNPSVSFEQAWDPAFALDHGACRLRDGIAYCGDDEGGVASYRVGRLYARQWVDAGKPPTGGPTVGGQDVFARCRNYVQSVRNSAH